MNILDYLRNKGIEPKQVTAAGQCNSPCPFCGGNDRFVIYTSGRAWCNRCDFKGDLIDLVKMIEGVDYKTACQITGATPAARQPKVFIPARQTLKQIEPPPATWQNAAAEFVERSHQALLKNERLLSWLKSERLLSLDTVKRFKLGWNASTVYATRQAWGLPEKISEKTGKPLKVWLPVGLVIPCHDIEGRLIRLKIRQPEADPRYVLIPGSSTAPALFGQTGPAFMVVESELDAVLLFQESGDFVAPIAAGGVSIKPDQATVEAMAAGLVSFVCFDNDEAGRDSKKFLPWRNALSNYYLFPIPAKYGGKDPTEAAQAGFSLRNWVAAGLKTYKENQPLQTEPSEIETQSRHEAETIRNDMKPSDPNTTAPATTESQELQMQPVESQPASQSNNPGQTIHTPEPAATPDTFTAAVRAIELAELADEEDVKLIGELLDALDFFQAQADQDGLQFAVETLTLTITEIEKKLAADKARDASTTREPAAVFAGQRPEDLLLIVKAAEVAERSSEADRAEISRALNTLDTCQAGTDDYNFALSVLATAVEDASARLLKVQTRVA